MRTRWQTAAAFMGLGLVFFSVRPGHASDDADALRFFKSYFITGDYAVAGVGLRGDGKKGIATGKIEMRNVPPDAEVLAAFLYWQVVSKRHHGPDSGVEGATFNGFALESPDGPLAKVLDPNGITAPCWSSGGGTGKSGGAKRTYTYRADVLRFLPVDESTGRHIVNGKHTVQLPDSGKGSKVPIALGASFVVVYKDPSPDAPLSAIVIYDGSYSMDNDTEKMTQKIEGFYDPAPVKGKMTHIVGSGQANKPERLVVLGREKFNPFRAAQGDSWDNYTLWTYPATGPSFTTKVDHKGFSSFDCLTWGAIIYRTEVRDKEKDGLLDKWETEQLYDPNGQPLPDLAGMGADPMVKDLFVEVGYLETTDDVQYGADFEPAHSHLPTPGALKTVGDAFFDNGIHVHFDVGDGYWDPDGLADPYLIPSGLARGGEYMNELATVCEREDGDAPWICQFSDYPGTIGWKSGFRFFKDALIDPSAASGDMCDAPGNDGPGEPCERVFDRNRKDMFRYALFAHALGVPRESCLGDDGFPDLECMDTIADYHVPVTNTGVADFPGGDVLITLGAFDDMDGKPVGTDFWVASTLMHELGHAFELRHGGERSEPNCKPNYLSVMNYLFQLRGLVDDDGVPHVDFSSQSLIALDENDLMQGEILGDDVPYRTAWYAPLEPGTLPYILEAPAAMTHCDGSPRLASELVARIDGSAEVIDWNGDGSFSDSSMPQDINFDGELTELNRGSNDWNIVRLNQVGSRRNVGAWFYVPDPDDPSDLVALLGPMSLDVGRGDLGRGDLGRGDLGRGDLGRGDLGRGDLGRGDLGRGDLGRGDLGRGDLGRGDLGRGDLGRGDLGRGDLGVGTDEGAAEIDTVLAASLGNSPPNALTGSIVGEDDCTGLTPDECHRVRLQWKAPNVGSVSRYFVRRIDGGKVTPSSVVTAVGELAATVGQADYVFIDETELPMGQFTYFVVAEFVDATRSGSSNFLTITAINDAPEAADDHYDADAGIELVVAAPGVLANDADVDSPTLTAELVTGPSNGVLALSSDGSFTYTPEAGFTGEDVFTYVANDVDPKRSSNVATVTITVGGSLYGFEPVQNLPPPSGKKFRPGTRILLKWRFTRDGVAVDSSEADPKIKITGPGGKKYVFTLDDPGHSWFGEPTKWNGWTWSFKWKTVTSHGKRLPRGYYHVEVTSQETDQTFDGGTIRLK